MRRPPRRARSPLPLRRPAPRHDPGRAAHDPLPSTPGLLDCAHGPRRVRPLPLRLPARLPVAVPRRGQRRRPPRGGRLPPPRRARGVDERRRRLLRRAGRCARGLAVTGRRGAGHRRSGSSAPTPTRPTCGSSPAPTRAASAGGSSAVEVYGGALVNSWLDRDLGLSGRVVAAATARSCWSSWTSRWPASRSWPSTSTATSTSAGLLLDKQQHLTPVWGLGQPAEGTFVEFVAAAAGRRPGRHRGLGPDAARPHAAVAPRRSSRSSSRPPGSTTSARRGPR